MGRVQPEMFACVFTAGLVLACVGADLYRRTIPNNITLTGLALGVLFHASPLEPNTGVGFALAGSALGIAILIIPFALGGMGGGDVKMLAAVGAWAGAEALLWITLYAALVGGLLALSLLLIRRTSTRFREIPRDVLLFLITRTRIQMPHGHGSLPYSLAIAGGWLVFQFVGRWNG